MKPGDLVRIVVPGSWNGFLGVILGRSVGDVRPQRYVLTSDGDWYFDERYLEVIDENR
jgi:hypothetical protein